MWGLTLRKEKRTSTMWLDRVIESLERMYWRGGTAGGKKKESEEDGWRTARATLAAGLDDMSVGVCGCPEEISVNLLTQVFSTVLESGRIPRDREVVVFKNKGDVQSCCNYGGIKLNHIMKLWGKLLMFGYEERWWSMIRARASCWEITRQMFVFRVLLKYKEGQEWYCLCGCIESLWWEGTVAPHEEITSSSEVWGQRDSGDVCSRNAKTMVWVRWETRDARKTQMLGFVWLSDSASFTVIQSVLTITLLNDIMWTEEKTYILYAALVMAATSQIFVWPCAAGPVSGPTHAVGHGLSVELHRWDPGGLWWANMLCFILDSWF